jgi:hypothetical protein
MSQEAKTQFELLLERSNAVDYAGRSESKERFDAIRKSLNMSLVAYHLTREEDDVLHYYIDQATEIDVTKS